MTVIQLAVVGCFVAVHVFAERLRFLGGLPRSQWLSFAGGVSVSYVFIHILPELRETQGHLEEAWEPLRFLEHHAYLVALLGLSVFYGLERMVKVSHGESRSSGVFWIHIGSFAIYNGLIGYLLVHREQPDLAGLVFYAAAMSLHFLVNDFGMQQHHQEDYRRTGRWILVSSIIAGWLIGLATEIGEAALGVLFALLAGGVILNVLKEELPEERQSRFFPFFIGVTVYSAILILS